MLRKIITIDEEKCNGCGACAAACHEGAIGMVDGKAKLLRDDYCDGLGDCLPSCPTGAITFEEREAAAYDKEAVEARMGVKSQEASKRREDTLPCGCPASQSRGIRGNPSQLNRVPSPETDGGGMGPGQLIPQSCLAQWPVQIKLAPVNAPYFHGAKLLIAADCTAFAYGNFHKDFIDGHVTLVGCPKLDAVDYSEKLTDILRENDIKSVTVVRMEVPCCGGIEQAVKKALMDSGKFIPWQVYTISVDGRLLD